MLCHIHIAAVQLDETPFLDALVWLCGSASKDMNGIEGKIAHVALEGVDDTIPSALQHDDEEQAAGHSKACGYSAHLVALDGTVYLLQCVQHSVISSESLCRRGYCRDSDSLLSAQSHRP